MLELNERRKAWLAFAGIIASLTALFTLVAGPDPGPDPTPGCEGVDVLTVAEVQGLVPQAGTTYCLGEVDATVSTLRPAAGSVLDGLGPDKTVLRAGPQVRHVINYDDVPDVTIRDLRVTGAFGPGRPAGVRSGDWPGKRDGRGIWAGPRTLIENVEADDNDQSGIGGGFTGRLVRVHLHSNGSSGYLGCCAGGVKSGQAFTIVDSRVHDNVGVGIWCDVVCKGGVTTIERNIVERNTKDGIRLEWSSRGPVEAVVRANTVAASGEYGIAVVAFSRAILEGNTVTSSGGRLYRFADTPRGNSSGSVDQPAGVVQGCTQQDVLCRGE